MAMSPRIALGRLESFEAVVPRGEPGQKGAAETELGVSPGG